MTVPKNFIFNNISKNYRDIFGLPDDPSHPGMSMPHFGSFREIRRFFKDNGIKTSDIDRIYETDCKYLKRRVFDMPKWSIQWDEILSTLEAQVVLSRSICKSYADAVHKSIDILGIKDYDEKHIDDDIYKKSRRNLEVSSDIVEWSIDNHPLVVANKTFIDMMLNTKIPNDFAIWDLKPPYKNMIVAFKRDELHIGDFYNVIKYNGKVYDKSELKKNPSITMVHLSFEYEPEGLSIFRSAMGIKSGIGILYVKVVIWLDNVMNIPMVLNFTDGNRKINDYINDRFDHIKTLGTFIFSLILFYMSGPEEGEKSYSSRIHSKKRIQIDKKSEKIQIWKPIILGQKFDNISDNDPIDDGVIGHKKRPHWRCGHFRRINKDIIWIKPTLVNAHLLRK